MLDRLKWLLCAHFLLCLLSGHSSSLWGPTHVLEMQGCTVSFHMHMSAVLVVEFLQRTLAGEVGPAGGHTHTHEVPGLSSRGGGDKKEEEKRGKWDWGDGWTVLLGDG